MFAFTFRLLMPRHHVFHLWFYAWNLLCNLAAKQVTHVSLVLKDSDMKSENFISLIWLSVSDGSKTDSSNIVSFIGLC